MRRALLLAAAALAACGEPYGGALSIDDYRSWPSQQLRGPAPGHGDTLRVVYVNPEALEFERRQYPQGSILVKEIYAGDTAADDELAYLAAMRRETSSTAWGEQLGWVFTIADGPGGDETVVGSCWGNCHQAAPVFGAFYDYSHLATP
jgi:hypothetical protein